MKKLKFRHKIESVLHFIRLLETRNHDVSAQTPGVNEQKLRNSDKIPGDNDRKLRDSDKTPGDNCSFSRNSAQERGTIIRFHEILLRNEVQSSDFTKFYSGTGYNYQISRNSAQERGTIIRFREILLRN